MKVPYFSLIIHNEFRSPVLGIRLLILLYWGLSRLSKIYHDWRQRKAATSQFYEPAAAGDVTRHALAVLMNEVSHHTLGGRSSILRGPLYMSPESQSPALVDNHRSNLIQFILWNDLSHSFLSTKFTDIVLFKVTAHSLDLRAFVPRPSGVCLGLII